MKNSVERKKKEKQKSERKKLNFCTFSETNV